MSNATAAASNVVDLPNDNRRKTLDAQIKKLGESSAQSNLAKPSMALAIVDAVTDGYLTKSDAEDTYKTYQAGRMKVLSKSNGLGVETTQKSDDPSFKANVSKNRKLLEAAELADLPNSSINFGDVLRRAVKIRETLVGDGVDCKPTFDVFVDCARAQIKQPTAPLNDDAIAGEAVKPGKDDVSEEDQFFKDLTTDYKRIAKRVDQSKGMPALVAALENLKQAFADIGKEAPGLTDEEKELAKVQTFARKAGLVLVKA